jgi:hypothetical protein
VEHQYVVGRIAPRPVQTKNYTLTGVIKDLNETPLADVNLILEGTEIGTKTNKKGEFSLLVPVSEKLEKQVLLVSYLGFEVQKINVDQETKPLSIYMVEEIMILGEIAIQEFPEKKKDTINKVKSLFRKKCKK